MNNMETINYNAITLNYKQLACIAGVKATHTKALFLKVLKVKDIKTDAEVITDRLLQFFKSMRSNDPNIDGINHLTYFLMTRSEGYKPYLCKATNYERLMLVGGESVFYKIMSDEQKHHALKSMDYYCFHRKQMSYTGLMWTTLGNKDDKELYYLTGYTRKEFEKQKP